MTSRVCGDAVLPDIVVVIWFLPLSHIITLNYLDMLPDMLLGLARTSFVTSQSFLAVGNDTFLGGICDVTDNGASD
jgi:hypothetical protein